MAYYYCSLVYASLAQERHKTNKYGERVVQMTAETFQRLANELSKMVVEKDVIEHNVSKAAVLFCSTLYINDARHFPGETILETERWKKPGENNVQFCQGKSPSSHKDFSTFRIITVQVLRSIALSEELLEHYGNKYKSHRWSRD